MSLTEKFDKKAYPVLVAELVLMAAAIQINIFFKGGLSIKSVFAITIGIMLAIGLTDCFKLYPAVGALIVVAGIVIVWQRDITFPFLMSNIMVRVIGLMVLAAVALYISQHFFVMRLLVCLGYWGAMIFLIHKNLFPVKQVMFFLAAELVFVLAECYDRVCYRNESKRNKKMLCMWPAVLLIVMVIAFLPYNKEPLKWSRTKKFINTVSYHLEIFIDNVRYWGEGISEFGLGYTGYNEKTNFFGNKINMNGEALELTMLGNKEHVYLVGNIKNEYTGTGWSGNPENSQGYGEYKEYQLDAAEYLYALYRAGIMDGKTNIWYIHFREMAVKYAGVSTASLFKPSKTIVIDDVENRGRFMDTSDNVSFSRNQNKKTSYNLKYFALNRSSEFIDNILREQSSYKYDTILSAEYKNFQRAIRREYKEFYLPDTEDFEATLKQRAGYIRKTYRSLPDSVTERTYELAEQITAGCSTDYDKMNAIIKYLADYEYTLTPGEMPEGVDIADYFLFESKKGYCTHFATAAAVLGRCVGIPTRYAQGYLLSIANLERFGEYTVKDDQAHAWVECYFEGVGWLTFEPTPSNISYLYQEWEEPDWLTGDKETEADRPITVIPDEEEEEEPEELPEDITTDIVIVENKKNNISPYIYIPVAIIIFVAAYIIYLKICEFRFWRYYKKASYSRKVRLDVLMIMWIMKDAGRPMRDTETLREYFDRMRRFYIDRDVVLKNVCEIYMRIRYGNKKEITKEEYQTAQRLRLNFMDKSVNEGAMARQCFRLVRDRKRRRVMHH